MVYGGGGIMPDIFVPLDTSKASNYYSELYRKGIFNQFTYDFVDKQREALKSKYKSFSDYKESFVVDEKLLEDFYQYAANKGIKKDEAGITLSKEYIILQIKAMIAKDIFDFSAYIQMYSTIDEAILKAIEVLNDNTFDKMKIKH